MLASTALASTCTLAGMHTIPLALRFPKTRKRRESVVNFAVHLEFPAGVRLELGPGSPCHGVAAPDSPAEGLPTHKADEFRLQLVSAPGDVSSVLNMPCLLLQQEDFGKVGAQLPECSQRRPPGPLEAACAGCDTDVDRVKASPYHGVADRGSTRLRSQTLTLQREVMELQCENTRLKNHVAGALERENVLPKEKVEMAVALQKRKRCVSQ